MPDQSPSLATAPGRARLLSTVAAHILMHCVPPKQLCAGIASSSLFRSQRSQRCIDGVDDVSMYRCRVSVDADWSTLLFWPPREQQYLSAGGSGVDLNRSIPCARVSLLLVRGTLLTVTVRDRGSIDSAEPGW